MCQEPGKLRWCAKPLETRALHIQSSRGQRGHVQLWVDIMTPEDALEFPMEDIALPMAKEFQIRVVIWKVRPSSFCSCLVC